MRVFGPDIYIKRNSGGEALKKRVPTKISSYYKID